MGEMKPIRESLVDNWIRHQLQGGGEPIIVYTASGWREFRAADFDSIPLKEHETAEYSDFLFGKWKELNGRRTMIEYQDRVRLLHAVDRWRALRVSSGLYGE